MLLPFQPKSEKDQINGYASLDNNRKLPAFAIPDDVTRTVQGTLRTGDNTQISTSYISEGENLYHTD
jgi:hypothetical protein